MANSDITPNNPPYPAFRATNKESFAYDTTVRRWPIIIDSAIVDIQKTIDEVEKSDEKKAKEGTLIIQALEDLKKELAADAPLRPIKDNHSDTDKWNTHLQTWFSNCTWFNGTWLFNECYIYRRIYEIFNLSTHWQKYDCFERQKINTFRGSHAAVFDLATKMPGLIDPANASSLEKLELIYHELIQVCLWGNATDLSLLTNMSKEDIQRLQAVEKDRLAERRQYILADDTQKVWEALKRKPSGVNRVDFVLDNAGFEVFVDMIFADWLLQVGLADKIVFHCKEMPWFVSDVMPKDMPLMFQCCLDEDFFAEENKTEADRRALMIMVKRWQQYVQDGVLECRSHDFWTYGLSYWYMKSEAPDLFEDMKKAKLVLYKGDLNYRKLVFDCDFPVTTPFKEAIGPAMANDFTHIVTLRTNKADPVVGLTDETKRDIESRATRQEWRFSGKYAVVEFN
ncbi:DUF89 domain-containing protein [Mycotypha africana]|uniref:DUF89 domain-containing protein n=1 Tax=Mycotypha africana TaxID=64632 RepID=UPI002301C187|nr:DUF89 domain-containing protein [Mycotypha africana]KAI8979139.1 DUF89 domain-containing protein [Mycotypha africana]